MRDLIKADRSSLNMKLKDEINISNYDNDRFLWVCTIWRLKNNFSEEEIT